MSETEDAFRIGKEIAIALLEKYRLRFWPYIYTSALVSEIRDAELGAAPVLDFPAYARSHSAAPPSVGER